ncbi:5'-3' exoribonuclease 1 isoform X2 [Agrilus planipennis]|uniref:5'-3' exoribonuclease 1 n=1 Tax=Agrilus planipennis TaxID=224129 RepID=A0A1W4WDF9_AGRPL|nr:5'-3' exoribonuclease 1 isoform X2 [Agrilus planipennis]
MGVPKFFRYISERYPCLSEVVKEYQLPEFDNLYLDMNGIIHTCSHPDDGDPHFRITEEKIFRDIFHYIEVLFRMIKPQKLFFMAVDGVAPRAKMNQQRGRRFRTAKEALELEQKALAKGEKLPTQARFDSNCITPGTEFMVKLQEQLKYFIVTKISTDPLWQKCKIVLSGHETPGEGEHKIMDYIRYMRSQPGYDPNTRHCLYGLDADLIMLGLCTHEPHFSLLREEVKFGKKSTRRKNIPEQMTFFLLHLSLMREYLELEFLPLQKDLPFPYDLERIIDDWVLMGFLVGNDFIPNLPNMHIANGALPVLYKAYMKALPKLGGYINESGTLNLERFEEFMKELAEIDIENFSDQYADLKWFEAKTGRDFNGKEKNEKVLIPFELEDKPEINNVEEKSNNVEKKSENDIEIKNESIEKDKNVTGNGEIALGNNASSENGVVENWEDRLDESDTSDSDNDLFLAEFKQHKTDYYMNKLEYEQVTQEVLKAQAEGYVRAIQWNLHYYYNGVCSWSWYYPHHYAPYVSDIQGFKDLKLKFDLGKPFKPFEQLLAVLPSASKNLLPEAYQDLMTKEDSPLKKYYPENFQTDLNGKRQEWEAVVLIPFIDEKILLEGMEQCNERLSPDEKQRNSHGPMLIYEYSVDDTGRYEAPDYFPALAVSHAKCTKVPIENIRVPMDKLIKGSYPGVKMDVFYPGFPTMKHLEYTAVLGKAKVKVFEQASRNENMIVSIVPKKDVPAIDVLAKKMLGSVVYVSWPHLVEALVVSISNEEYRYIAASEKGQYNVEENKGNSLTVWRSQVRGITQYYMSRLGINVGETQVLVHVRVMIGRKYAFTPQGRVNLEKQWAVIESAYPLQAVVQNIAVYEKKYEMYKSIGNIFSVGTKCFMLGQPYYGAVGEVLESKESLKNVRIKVDMKKTDEPDFTEAKDLAHEIATRYIPLQVAAAKLSISKSLFSRITGCIFVIPTGYRNIPMESNELPKINIGLNLKLTKKNEEIPGYTRKDANTWMYSEKAVALVENYLQRFPTLVQYLNQNQGNDVYFEEDIYPDGDGKEQIKEITAWIKKQPFYSVERQVCGSIGLYPDVIKKIEEIIDKFKKRSKIRKVVMEVKPHLLYVVGLQIGNLMPDPTTTFLLYDRVVNIRESYTVPVGLKGTIIAVRKPQDASDEDTMYDVLFDEEFSGGLELNCLTPRAYRLPRSAMINISHGERMLNQKTGVVPGQLLQNLNTDPQYHKNYYMQNGAISRPSGHFRPSSASPYQQWGFPNSPVSNYGNFRPPLLYNNNGPSLIPPQQCGHPRFHIVPYDVRNNGGPYPPKPSFVPSTQQQSSVDHPPSKSGPSFGSSISMQNCHNFMPGFAKGSSPGKHFYEQKRVKGAPLSYNTQNNITSTPSGSSTAMREPMQVTKEEHPRPSTKVDTELLKKMLRINEGANQRIPVTAFKQTPVKEIEKPSKLEQSTPLNVQDIFAHARNKAQTLSDNAFSTAKLLNYYKSLDLGCPRYQFFELPKKMFQAQITLPDGSVVSGNACQSKENACDSAAAEALKILTRDNKVEESHTLRIQKQTEVLQRKAENDKTVREKEKKIERSGNVEFNKKKDSTNLETSNNTVNNSGSKGQRQVLSVNSFVPLQAIRNRTKSGSNRSVESNTTANLTVTENKNKLKEDDQETEKCVTSQSSKGAPMRRRGERKMRIAANFQATGKR